MGITCKVCIDDYGLRDLVFVAVPHVGSRMMVPGIGAPLTVEHVAYNAVELDETLFKPDIFIYAYSDDYAKEREAKRKKETNAQGS